jgi:hypothetical protein
MLFQVKIRKHSEITPANLKSSSRTIICLQTHQIYYIAEIAEKQRRTEVLTARTAEFELKESGIITIRELSFFLVTKTELGF